MDAAISSNDPMVVRTWPVWDPLRSHVSEVARRADGEGIAMPTARLIDRLATLLQTKGLYAEAEPLLRRAVEITEASLGDEHPRTKTFRANLDALLEAVENP